jgi:signal transduction histidine kinase
MTSSSRLQRRSWTLKHVPCSLIREPSNIEGARSAAARFVKDVTRAAEIIRRIGQLFKKDTVQREPIDINELVTEMADLMHSEAVRHGVSLRLDLEPALPQIVGDRVGLQQVMLNLMANGIEAIRDTGSGGFLSVKSRLDDDGALAIAVIDTGPGVTAGQEAEIFNTFFTTKPRGTGMGPSISRSIVEAHVGQLWITKNEPHGAVFHFTITNKMAAERVSPEEKARV